MLNIRNYSRGGFNTEHFARFLEFMEHQRQEKCIFSENQAHIILMLSWNLTYSDIFSCHIYSLAVAVTFNGFTIMRGHVIEFSNDQNVFNIVDQFMFGNAIMVCPMTEYSAKR